MFVSDNGGPFVPFLLGTTDTSAVFTGEIGHTYEFLAVAIDNVGQRQPRPADAQARTTLVPEPLQVRDVDFVARSGRIVKIVVSFNQPVAAGPAGTLSNYRADRGRPGPAARDGGRPGPATRHGQIRPGHEHGPAAAQPAAANGNFFHLVVEGDTGLTTPTGEPIDGNGDLAPGGDFHHIFGRGKELKYFDANGDRVVLRLAGGGVMELTRDLDGEGLDLALLNTRPGKTRADRNGPSAEPAHRRRPDHAAVNHRARRSDNRLTDPPFIIGNG